MKNYLILGLASLLLFSVAAGLSMWLQQSKTQTAEDKAKDQEKETKKGLKDDKDKGAKDDKSKEKGDPVKPKDEGVTGPLTIAAEQKEQQEALKRREQRLEKRQAQVELILQDIRTQRDEVDNVAKKVAGEMKLLAARAADPETAAQPDPAPKKPIFAEPRPPQADPSEKKNLERLAVMYEAMPPETAAKILQEMADRGNMDSAVKVLGQMRERQAGKVIAEMPDTTLAAQLLEKLRQLKRPPVAASTTGTGS
jgi:flagellar motility protein MotE (MotC chaperone)